MYVPLRPGSRFRSIYRMGSKHRSGGITVFVEPGLSVEPEAGFVAGKKVGNAVARNRSKRRLREAVRRLDLAPRTAYVFVASREVLDAPFPTLVGWLERAIRDVEVDMDVRA